MRCMHVYKKYREYLHMHTHTHTRMHNHMHFGKWHMLLARSCLFSRSLLAPKSLWVTVTLSAWHFTGIIHSC